MTDEELVEAGKAHGLTLPWENLLAENVRQSVQLPSDMHTSIMSRWFRATSYRRFTGGTSSPASCLETSC